MPLFADTVRTNQRCMVEALARLKRTGWKPMFRAIAMDRDRSYALEDIALKNPKSFGC